MTYLADPNLLEEFKQISHLKVNTTIYFDWNINR